MAQKQKTTATTVKERLSRRTGFIVVFFAALLVFVFGTMLQTTLGDEGEFWRSKVAGLRVDSLRLEPKRGNIFTHDGKLLASSIPEYKLYVDFKAEGLSDSIFFANVDSLAYKLSEVYKTRSASGFRKHLNNGYSAGRRWFLVDSKPISYMDFKKVSSFPLFSPTYKIVRRDTLKDKDGNVRLDDKGQPRVRLSRRRVAAGILPSASSLERVKRVKPFGTVAAATRTIGGMYAEKGKGGSSGLEQTFEADLKGSAGVATLGKTLSSRVAVPLVEPVDGLDVVSTIDIDFQGIVDDALSNKLMETGAERGCAILMEVESGEVRAISNFQRFENNGKPYYRENQNFAMSALTEPGSTFKTASMIVALEDGVVDTGTVVNTGNGLYKFHNSSMKDWNIKYGMINGKWQPFPYNPADEKHSSGYGKISFAQALWYSSNIGISKVINDAYKDNPERFVERLYDMGLVQPMDFKIRGAAEPYIKHPDDKSSKWSGTSLPWMSIGYELQMPPMYVLAFYNAIANDGKMIAPKLVKSVRRNGVDVKVFPTETVKKSICSEKTLGKVRQMLIDVVEKGTAKAARSEYFKIAGKTGTAQVDYGKSKSKKTHQLTFCGYFPADKPKYTCAVVVWAPKIYPSAGNICGPVVKNIAERVYAISPLIETDSDVEFAGNMPVTKDGKREDLKFVLDKLDIPFAEQGKDVDSEWVRSSANSKAVAMDAACKNASIVPNVKGMGAKDAVYLLENRGLKVSVCGVGRVAEQSVEPGTRIVKNMMINLVLN